MTSFSKIGREKYLSDHSFCPQPKSLSAFLHTLVASPATGRLPCPTLTARSPRSTSWELSLLCVAQWVKSVVVAHPTVLALHFLTHAAWGN